MVMEEFVTAASAWHITKMEGGSAWYFRESCTAEGQKLWLYGFTNVKPELKEKILHELQEGSFYFGAILVEAPKEMLENILKEASKYITRAG